MADIAMCLDKACPAAATCRRSALSGTPVNEPYQDYMDFYRNGQDRCEEYWKWPPDDCKV